MGSSSVGLRAAWVVDPPEPDADDPASALTRFGERLADAGEGTAAEDAPAAPVVLVGADSRASASRTPSRAPGRPGTGRRPAGRHRRREASRPGGPHRDRRGGGIHHLVTAPRSPLVPTPPTRTRKVPMAVILSVSGSPSPTSRTARLLRHLDDRLRFQGHDVVPLDVRTLPADALLGADVHDPAITGAAARALRKSRDWGTGGWCRTRTAARTRSTGSGAPVTEAQQRSRVRRWRSAKPSHSRCEPCRKACRVAQGRLGALWCGTRRTVASHRPPK